MRMWIGAALLGAMMTAVPADAATLLFTLTGSYNASFQIDSNPTPDVSSDAQYFTVYDVTGTYPGAASNFADITFYNDSFDGGFSINDYNGGGIDLVITDGPQVYTGTEDAPTFRTGTFQFTEYGGAGAYTMTIAPVAAAPEPAAWGLMIAGFGIAGGALRRTRRLRATRVRVTIG